jgi:hypothetical protein
VRGTWTTPPEVARLLEEYDRVVAF